MESNTPKFRLRLNLFDGIVLVLALAVGAFLMWSALKPEPAAPAEGEAVPTTTIRYVVRVQRWPEGTGSLIEVGDKLVDSIKNLELGQVVEAEVVPAEMLIMNHTTRQYELAVVPENEDIIVTMESVGAESESGVILGSGYQLRVGATAYIRGEGYMASGPIISIEREGQA